MTATGGKRKDVDERFKKKRLLLKVGDGKTDNITQRIELLKEKKKPSKT